MFSVVSFVMCICIFCICLGDCGNIVLVSLAWWGLLVGFRPLQVYLHIVYYSILM